MGGYICFEFVRRYQEMLRGLILVATQPAADSDAARQARYETAEFVRREGSSALAERLIPRFLGKTTLATKPDVAETVRSLIQSNHQKRLLKPVTAWLLAEIRRLSSPKLRFQHYSGWFRRCIDPFVQAETMQREIRHSQLVVVEQCGHIINLEQPHELNQVVTSFLKNLNLAAQPWLARFRMPTAIDSSIDFPSGLTHIRFNPARISYVRKRGYFISLVSLVVELQFDYRRRSLFSNVCVEFAAAVFASSGFGTSPAYL